MTLEHTIRAIAGSFILLSLVLANVHSPHWLWFTGFVGANLLQSAFTRWCLMEDILEKLGVGGSCCGSRQAHLDCGESGRFAANKIEIGR